MGGGEEGSLSPLITHLLKLDYFTASMHCLNSLAPGRFQQNFRKVIFKLISVTDRWVISCKIALRWMPLDLADDKSTLVQVMAWCCQTTSHYLSQCWPRFMSPYGVTRPQWVNDRAVQATVTNQWHFEIVRNHYHLSRVVKLPWIFPGAPLKFNGAPGNIQGNIYRYASAQNSLQLTRNQMQF